MSGPDGASLEEWDAFLEEMLAEPDLDDEGVAGSIRMARFMIALRRGELDETGNILPPACAR